MLPTYRALCSVMKTGNVFSLANMVAEKESVRVVQLSLFSEDDILFGLKKIQTQFKNRISYHLILHFDQYCTLSTPDRGLKGSALDSSIRYLVVEENNFQTYEDWLVYFPNALQPGYLQVLAAAPEELVVSLQPLTLEMYPFTVIDSYDFALANAILYAGYGVEPVVLVIKKANLVRCIFIANKKVHAVQETALLEENEQDKNWQLTQRLAYYFQDYRNRDLLFLGINTTLSLPQLPQAWRFETLPREPYLKLFGNNPFSFDFLPLLGSGLQHA